MDPKIHPLDSVKELFDTLRPTQPVMYSLHIHRHELNCCRMNFKPKGAIEVARLRGDDIQEGLTVKTWNQIEAKIRTLLKQGVIEWHHQKP